MAVPEFDRNQCLVFSIQELGCARNGLSKETNLLVIMR